MRLELHNLFLALVRNSIITDSFNTSSGTLCSTASWKLEVGVGRELNLYQSLILEARKVIAKLFGSSNLILP